MQKICERIIREKHFNNRPDGAIMFSVEDQFLIFSGVNRCQQVSKRIFIFNVRGRCSMLMSFMTFV
jgi:hypothetical protein